MNDAFKLTNHLKNLTPLVLQEPFSHQLLSPFLRLLSKCDVSCQSTLPACFCNRLEIGSDLLNFHGRTSNIKHTTL